VGGFLAGPVLQGFKDLGNFITEHDLIDDILFAMAAGMTAYAVSATSAAIASFIALLPLYLLIAAIALIAAGLYYAYTNWGWFRTGVDKAIDILWDLMNPLDQVATVLQDIIDLIAKVISGFKRVSDALPDLPGGGGGFNPLSLLTVGSPAGLANWLLGREHGGPVTAGQPYVVGEKRPELFIPNTSGTIVPEVPGGIGGPAVQIGQLVARVEDTSGVAIARELRRAQMLVA
jgi:hypothetical protein